MMESMDEKKIELSAEDRERARQQSTADTVGAAIKLSYPSNHQDPTTHLAPLRDKHSNFTAVAKACLHLNQFALNGSSSSLDDTHSGVSRSSLLHDPSLSAALHEAFSGLTECVQTHLDRRARILACKTLAAVARATYAKLRHSPQLFALRDSTSSRLEDAVGTDVPMVLVGTALDNPDDGVAATALEALGSLCLSSGATTGTLVEDELWREIASLAQQRSSPYAPSLSDIEDEESYIPQVELQTRILENVINPRLLQLVNRVVFFEQPRHTAMILPVLTASLVHMSKTGMGLYAMNREAYTKRWVELDFVNLINTVAEEIMLPAMRSTSSGALAYSAAMASIRLIHACPQASWVDEASYWASLVLKEEIASSGSSAALETRLINLGSLLVVARALPLPKRHVILHFCFVRIQSLPSTTMAPHGIHTAGLLLEARGVWHYRRPARVALLAELALSYFLDGPVDHASDFKHPRSSSLETFFKSNEFVAACKETSNGQVIQLCEELAFVFCTVAIEVGRRHKPAPEVFSNNAQYGVAASHGEFLEWVRMSTMVLTAFHGCLSWSGASSATYIDEELTLQVAAQASYARLIQELAHAVGLTPSLSVSLKMTPAAVPPHMLWDQLEGSAELLGQFDSPFLSNQVLLDKLTKVMDVVTKKELNGNGLGNHHHMRLHLLTSAADQWVQGRYLEARMELEGKGSGQTSLNASHACDILEALSPRRIFSKLVEDHKAQIDSYSKKKKELYKKYAQDAVTACVAAVENIALAASDWRKRFGNSADTKSIYNAAISSLEGSGKDSTVLPVCQGAKERVQAAFASNDQAGIDQVSLSPLLLNARELKRRPVVTATRATQGQRSYHEGYLMQLSRQIVSARIDRCVLSFPAIQSLVGTVRKLNWLRLALPPLPQSRNPQKPISHLPKFSWGSGVSTSSGGSDAAAMTLAYSVRRCMRYDGEDEFRLLLLMRVHNITAVEIPEGLRLNLGMLQEAAETSLDGQDRVSKEIMSSLSEADEEFTRESMLASALVLYKSQLKSGEHLTWELIMDHLPMSGAIRLQPSIEYRGLEDEMIYATLLGGRDGDRDDTSATSGMSQQSTNSKGEGAIDIKENDQKQNIVIQGEAMRLSPLVGLQPCPLVFFRDGCGDIDAFRFLWSRMPCQITPLKVGPESSSSAQVQVSYDTLRLAAICTIKFEGNAIPGGYVTKIWAFMSLTGKRVLFVLAESEDDGTENGTADRTIHVRGDDKQLLCCLTGTKSARKLLVGALLPGLRPE